MRTVCIDSLEAIHMGLLFGDFGAAFDFSFFRYFYIILYQMNRIWFFNKFRQNLNEYNNQFKWTTNSDHSITWWLVWVYNNCLIVCYISKSSLILKSKLFVVRNQTIISCFAALLFSIIGKYFRFTNKTITNSNLIAWNMYFSSMNSLYI